MTILHQYISVIGGFQGVLLFILLVTDSRVTGASRVLGLFCLVLGVTFFLPFITFGFAPALFNPLAAWLFFFPVMYGPLIYLYCCKVVFDKPLKITDLVHLTPLLFCYLLNIDALFYYNEEFRLWIVGSPAPTSRLWLSEYLLFGFIIFYILAAAMVLKRYHERASNTLSNFNPSIFKWLGSLIGASILVMLAKAIMGFTNFATLEMLIISDALIVIMIYMIALAQWRSPMLFTVDTISDEEQEFFRGNKDTTSESTGSLDTETRASLFETVKTQIEQEFLYRDSELTLSKLADSTGISTHHLSEVLNQHAGKNFNQFVNAYRVEEVCERLRAQNTIKVLDIALDAGFSSKSTFNTIFKKFKGMTPSQFRQQVQV